MARFRIVGSRPTRASNTADFDVLFLEGALAVGEKFNVFDTHHPIICTVVEIFAGENLSTLRCELTLGLGWENQFAGAIIDTQAEERPASFRYDHKNDPHWP